MATETGSEKVKKICEVLRKETLEPAMEEAEKCIADAREEAESILAKAKAKADKLVQDGQSEIDKRRNVFHASMQQGCRQTLEELKEQIEKRLFNQALFEAIAKKTSSPDVLAKLITAIVNAIEKEGLSADLSAIIPAHVPAREVNELLAREVSEKLREKSVLLGPQKGGAEVKLHDKKITIDLSEGALRELVGSFIRKDLREILFGPSE
ncbi:MAG: V-type proton ATPase subunit E [Chlamydiae bacterium]|nr:V-type proton ATPase subunit E [Chlamydiota bacterium]